MPNYIKSYYNVDPSYYTDYIGSNSYLILDSEPTIFDKYINNYNISNKTLDQELLPLKQALPKFQTKIGQLKNKNLFELSKIFNELIETNDTVLSGAWTAFRIVSNYGLQFHTKNDEYVPLKVTEGEYTDGVSLVHIKTELDGSESANSEEIENIKKLKTDDFLMGWSIEPNVSLSSILMANTTNTKNILGPKLLNMLNSLGWPTKENPIQQSLIAAKSVDSIFSLLEYPETTSNAYSIPNFLNLYTILINTILIVFILFR